MPRVLIGEHRLKARELGQHAAPAPRRPRETSARRGWGRLRHARRSAARRGESQAAGACAGAVEGQGVGARAWGVGAYKRPCDARPGAVHRTLGRAPCWASPVPYGRDRVSAIEGAAPRKKALETLRILRSCMCKRGLFFRPALAPRAAAIGWLSARPRGVCGPPDPAA